MPGEDLVDAFAHLPDPGQAATLDGLAERLRLLKVWAGDPSYEHITARVNAGLTAEGRPAGELVGRTTVLDCFRAGRRRLNVDLVASVVRVLHPDPGYVAQWRQALRVIGGRREAALQVRVRDGLPRDLAGFVGRSAELAGIRRALDRGRAGGGAVVISAIAGMAGVGKTQLAVRAGHLLLEDGLADRVLFVNLRGFHPDPTQPPADPAAVLEGFLHLLGVPAQRIPHDLAARTALYRDRLAGTRTLVVLDNAADAQQVVPLLPGTAGCPVLVTSRRELAALRGDGHVAVDVFSPAEALEFVKRATKEVPTGTDPQAAARLTRRCGYLPLALSLVTAHIRGTPGWTLTDHADRLDERHRQQRLENGVQLALDLSYHQLPAERQRLLRLVALHPGQDLDADAAAALADHDLPTTEAALRHLCRDHLLEETSPGRYALHDLIRAYAANRAGDQDPASVRRPALTRLFDHYLAGAAAAMDTLHPAETHRRPKVTAPGRPAPALASADAARSWLAAERPTLVAVAAHTAARGWPAHTIQLSLTLFRYLSGGYHTDALAIHSHAREVVDQNGDLSERTHVRVNLGVALLSLARYGAAADQLNEALGLARQAGDPFGEARALTNLGAIEAAAGRYEQASAHHEETVALYRQAGDRASEARALGNLGALDHQLGRHAAAAERVSRALVLFQETGDHAGEEWMLSILGYIETGLNRYEAAEEHLRQALDLSHRNGDRTAEGWTLESLGHLYTRWRRPAVAVDSYQQALTVFRESGERAGEVNALNGLGDASRATGSPAAAGYYTEALAVAVEIDDHEQQARAHAGLDSLTSKLEGHAEDPVADLRNQ